MTFNGSSDLYSTDGCGYDIPWIVKRSQLNLSIKTKILSLDKDMNIRGNIISGIKELPLLYFIDLSHKMIKAIS